MTVTAHSTIRTRRRMGAALAAVTVLGAATGCLPMPPFGSNGVLSACAAADGTIRLIDTTAGASCPEGQTLVEWNQQGPQGAAGPQGEPGPAGATGPTGPGQILDTLAASGFGINPTSALNQLGMHATVDVPDGARVHLVSTKTIGTTGTDGPAYLDAWICHRPAGTTDTFTTVGEKTTIRLAGGDRIPLTMSTVLEGLPAGQHEVGLCAQTNHPIRWNDNSAAYVTAMVLAGD